MIKFSIIINTHNQNEYIDDAINSCLEQTYENFEIIIVDSSDQKLNLDKYLNNKIKIDYIYVQSKNKIAEINQMNKIIKGCYKSTGNYIILLDGDDYFHKKKLLKLKRLIEEKDIICNQDLPIIFKKNLKQNLIKKNYKNNFFIKFLLNNWPQIYGTSSIVVKKEFLNKFFIDSEYYKWKFLAIDAQLILFSSQHKSLTNYLEGFTFKRIHKNNLGSSYMNIFKRRFWSRRYMQFQYWEFLGNNYRYNLDSLITKSIYLITKYL